MKQLFLLILSVGLAILFFVFHQLVMPTAWLSVGLALGCAWYLLDPAILFPRYHKLTELDYPLSRSLWLLLVYWPLTIFVVTSTGSWLAQGLVMALGLGIGIELISYFSQPSAIPVAFHFPSQSKWTAAELQIASVAWIIGLGVLAGIMVI